MYKNITAFITSLYLLSSPSFAFSADKTLIEGFVAESDVLDRKFISLDIGYAHSKIFGGFYLKGRIVAISEPGTTYTEDSSGLYVGAGIAAPYVFSPYIEAGIDIIDFIDIIVDENLDKDKECQKTNSCEYIHRDFYIKAGARITLAKNLLIGAFFERIAITNDDTIGSPYHNVTGLSVGYLF